MKRGPRRDLIRIETRLDTAGLPVTLIDAIEAEGGLWSAGDYYTDASVVVARCREVGAVALRLDFRDLSLLEQLPAIRYLHLRSDGQPVLDPVASLTGLRALIVNTRALRGVLDPLAFAELRWLRLGLGGKGGRAVTQAILSGHPGLEYLSIAETTVTSVTEIASAFSNLRHVRIGYADRLRTLGPLERVARTLRGLVLEMTQIRSLDGIEVLQELEALALFGGHVTDLTPLRSLRRLRYVQLDTVPGVASLEPLRDHPALRMLDLSLVQDGDLSPLETISGLVAVGRGPRLEAEPRWPDLRKLPREHPFRDEWARATRG